MASTGALRSGPLCWGQHWSWQDQLRPPGQRSLNLVFVRRIEVPTTFSTADVAEMLRPAIDRHESLRTTYHASPDSTATQVVWPPYPARYEIRDLPLPDRSRWPPWDFDLTCEWPVKVGLVRTTAGTSHLLLAVHHIATDHVGMGLLVAELLRPTESDPPAAPCRQPLDFAAYENSPAGERIARRAITHWQRHLPDITQVLDATRARMTSATPTTSMYLARHVSGPARAYLADLANTLGYSEPTVLIGVMAHLLAQQYGLPAMVVIALGANRHLPGARGAVCALAQGALIRVACRPGAKVADSVRSAADVAITGYRHAYYDRRRLLKTLDTALNAAPFVDLPSVNIVHYADHAPTSETDTHTVDVMSRPCFGYIIQLHLYPNALAVEIRVGTHLTDAAAAGALAAGVVSCLHDAVDTSSPRRARKESR